MGMAAGQARLLSITARLSDNEQNGQALAFAKQRLADETDQINREYNEALNSTKLTVLTGFNGVEAQYTDISYGLLTEFNRLTGGKQYLVTNQKGQILVTDQIAQAYERGNGDFNRFINYFGLSQNDVDFTSLTGVDEQTGVAKTIQTIHNAWDKYITSAGLYFPDLEHDYSNDKVHFGWDPSTKGVDENGNVVLNVGSPYFVQDSVLSNVTYSTYKNVAVPGAEYGNEYSVADLDCNSELGLIPHIEVGTNVSMRQQVSSDGTTVTQNGLPVYIMDAYDKDGNPCQYKLAANSATPVYDNDGNLIGQYHSISIGVIDSDGSPINVLVNGNSVEMTSFGQMFAGDPESLYYDENYNWRLDLVADDSGNFYITDAGWQLGISGSVGLKELNSLVSNVHSTEEAVIVATSKNIPLNFEGTTQEQRELYDYAVALTQAYAATTNPSAAPRDKDGNVVTKSIASNPENASEIQYYRNIFNQMQQFGYVTESDMEINKSVNKLGVKDNNWFEQGLRQGKLLLKTYDASKGAFVNTTYAEDSNIQEVEDDRKIAKAEIDYTQAQEALERKDKKIDLELKKLDTEHNALQTEYEALKDVVDKNIQKSFNIFS